MSARTEVAREFSDESLFWRDYFYAIGDKLIEPGQEIPRPISFAEYCDKAAKDYAFRMFFDQVHMYLWSVANERASLETISLALEKLRSALAARNLVEGLVLKALATSLPTRNLFQSPIPNN